MVLIIKSYFAGEWAGGVSLPLPKLSPHPAQAYSVHTHVFQDFAIEGLRTLMVAYRELDNAFFQAWRKKHSEACLSLENREDKMSDVYEEMEKDLMVSMRKPGQIGGRTGGGSQ